MGLYEPRRNERVCTTFAPCDETGSVSDDRADLRVDLRSVAGVLNYSMHGFGSRI